MKHNFKLILTIYLITLFSLNLACEQTNNLQIISSLDLFEYQDRPIRLSILIATIEKRETLFNKLYQKLLDQLKTYQLEHDVEILFFKDNQTVTVGYKRNCLVRQARGEYVCFLDDDDDVCDDYLKLLYDACASKADCISCTGIFYVNGVPVKKFIHSLKYHATFADKTGTSYSPVYHINPVKRVLAMQVPFPECNRREDDAWSIQMHNRKILKTEYQVTKPYYFYRYIPNKKV